MFCLYTSSKFSRPKFEFSLNVKVMGSNPGYLLKYFLLYCPKLYTVPWIRIWRVATGANFSDTFDPQLGILQLLNHAAPPWKIKQIKRLELLSKFVSGLYVQGLLKIWMEHSLKLQKMKEQGQEEAQIIGHPSTLEPHCSPWKKGSLGKFMSGLDYKALPR